MPMVARGPRPSFAGDDPLSVILRPPADESHMQRSERIKREAEAKRVNDEIDKRLKEDAQRLKKERQGEHKILLLGQAAAGKTTILKQMRLLYDQNAHDRERQSWRAVVHLNLITAVRLLVEAVEAFDIDGTSGSSSPTPSAMEGMRMPLSPTQARGEGTSSSASNRALLARLRLAPLLSLETILRRRLGAAGEETDLSDPALAQNQQGWGSRTDPSSPSGRSNNNTLLLKAGWQDRLLSRLGVGNEDNSDTASIAESTSPKQQRRILGRRRSSSAIGRRKERDTSPAPPLPDAANTLVARKEDDPGKMLEALKEDILQLWSEPVVRRLRRKGKLDATDSASYFLDNLERIASVDYFPTDDDILHARVRTVGITEDKFNIDRNVSYRICDVGGSRNQRSFWAPYFDDAEAIIFLAPISAFDQRLVEDPRINRVDDSLELFSQIAENPLLKDVSLVLFLNKIDILERKLQQGIQVSKYFPDYEGENDFEEVWRWFRAKFRAIVSSRRSVAPSRPIYVHTTVATSTRQIKAILSSVNDTILRNHLRTSGLTYD